LQDPLTTTIQTAFRERTKQVVYYQTLPKYLGQQASSKIISLQVDPTLSKDAVLVEKLILSMSKVFLSILHLEDLVVNLT
jgi:hypothetical protein